MAYVQSLELAFPAFQITNEDAVEFIAPGFIEDGEDPEIVRGIFRNAQVRRRFLARPPSFLFEERSLTARNRAYSQVAREIGVEAARKAISAAGLEPRDIDLIIDTSCTGVMIPALDAYIANDLGMRKDVLRMPLNAVGCAGGAVALGRASDHLAAYPKARVLIVCLELPSLTLQLGDTRRANLVSAAIFGDGCAAAIVSNDTPTADGYELLGSRSILFPNSQDVMGFELETEGFKIILSPKIPLLVRQRLRGEVDEFLESFGLNRKDLGFLVLHPGGTKVLDNMKEVFEVDEDAVSAARYCLSEFGNLSSASVLTVARELRERGAFEDGQLGLLCAMGPGFAAEMTLMSGVRVAQRTASRAQQPQRQRATLKA
jgi:alkylresorcinol/alkylpyrone synthase